MVTVDAEIRQTAKQSRVQIIRHIFLAIPTVYLLVAPVIQMLVFSMHFDREIQLYTVVFVMSANLLFLVGYGGTFWRLTQRSTRSKARQRKIASLQLVLVFLGLASLSYVLVAVFRISILSSAFAADPAQVRQTLQITRTGISWVGFLNALLHAAPTVFLMSVILFSNELPVRGRTLSKAASVLFFGAFAYLLRLEGASLGVIISLFLVAGSIAVSWFRLGNARRIGYVLIATVFVIACMVAVSSGNSLTERQELFGNESAEATRNSLITSFNLSADADADAPRGADDREAPLPATDVSPAIASSGEEILTDVGDQREVLVAFYVSHQIAAIDRILSHRDPTNLYGLQTFSSFGKAFGLVLPTPDVEAVLMDYGVLGQYVGLVGSVLIEFGPAGSLVFMLALGAVCGFAISLTMTGGNSPFLLLAPIVPAFVVFSPFDNLFATSLGQALVVWVGLAVLLLFVGTKQRNE